jgi:hypothetical protein
LALNEQVLRPKSWLCSLWWWWYMYTYRPTLVEGMQMNLFGSLFLNGNKRKFDFGKL